MRDPSLSLLPDFVGRPVIVSFPVGLVRILIRIKILVGMIASQFTCHANRAIGSVGRIGIENICAVALQNLFPFTRNIFRHAKCYGKSFSRAQHGISDASIAAGGVE